MTLIRLGRVAGVEPLQRRFLFAFRGHFLNWKRLAGNAAVAEMGARNLIFGRTILGPGRHVHGLVTAEAKMSRHEFHLARWQALVVHSSAGARPDSCRRICRTLRGAEAEEFVFPQGTLTRQAERRERRLD